ncbi:MAG: hypothetical protein B7Y36_10435 [Novosphingobium sp. 28-62-57]|uniref:hypothetical protein n=1 Tax=unclassified Novosphingobium TaxID=2644732 RepID=UPI000BDB1EC9|nr:MULTISPECIES: hypothetical protein [unclassified Novosphingobium]OYW48611.1 MAG: hypothetical protein B7Z34_12855 [Novosphingobium sp. 12-62-10]OYZ10164.1 MAG: hypothetical protein B7Y36_10435 [Novosphingobium sp. 28-62-57]OZA38110.1 MAG: hypothetical protein B7X92_03910 [Novosphingobium sp. 17-62-9]HQS69028.1 hypothetical protein [Novosphingobium sp.]
MANSPAHESERILASARQSLVRQQAGGRRSIGQRSAELKRQHIGKKAARMAMAVGVLLAGAMVAGLVLDGIGFTGVMVLAASIVAALWFFATFPKMKVPTLAALNTGDVRTMVGRTELWLEAQRPALPAPAVQLVDQIGVQLDGLGLQLEGIDPAEPAVAEVRKLVGEHLPGMVESYRKIPAHLRREERGGRNADQQLADGLGKISTEIDTITRQLASGDLDALAVRGRFLDYRYGEGLESAPQLEAPKVT